MKKYRIIECRNSAFPDETKYFIQMKGKYSLFWTDYAPAANTVCYTILQDALNQVEFLKKWEMERIIRKNSKTHTRLVWESE